MDKRILTNTDCILAVAELKQHYYTSSPNRHHVQTSVYGVPRGGIPVAYLTGWDVVECPSRATLVVDDIVGTGATRDRYKAELPNTPFLALADFLEPKRVKGQWIVFPWEQGDTDSSADDIVTRLLQYVGENPEREGLKETPARFLRAWKEWTSGYGVDIAKLFKVFEDGGERYNEMVFVKDLPFFSHCEHHLAPFFGTATIAYIPDKHIVGLSKLGRVLDAFARRLQVQERLTVQVADAIVEHLKPKGAGVIIKARHMCMESRGWGRQGQCAITSALRGCFTDNTVRQEFLSIATK